ncbi:MAG TPA: hypothetical protein VIL11_08350 [Limnochordales bacterium]
MRRRRSTRGQQFPQRLFSHGLLAAALAVAAQAFLPGHTPARAWPTSLAALVGSAPGGIGSEGMLGSLPGGWPSLAFSYAQVTGPQSNRQALESHLSAGTGRGWLEPLVALTLWGRTGRGLHLVPSAGGRLRLQGVGISLEALWPLGLEDSSPALRATWTLELDDGQVVVGFRRFAADAWSGWFVGYGLRD